MKRVMRTDHLALLLAAITLAFSPGLAQNVEQVKPAFDHVIPNIQGKRMVAVVVTYPPGAKSVPHHHAPSAFIYAYVLSGAIRSKVDDAPTKLYQVARPSLMKRSGRDGLPDPCCQGSCMSLGHRT